MLNQPKASISVDTQHNRHTSEFSLTQRSAYGFLWTFSQTVVTRLVAFGGQLVLAWLLEPRAFGLIGLVYSVQAFATLVQHSGVTQILVAKQEQYLDLVNPAFWYALAMGLLAAVLMVVSAPFVAEAFGHPELIGLILVIAVAAPFNAVGTVCAARLSIDLRFRVSAVVNAASMTAQMALTVILAVVGFGVYSFVLPLIVTSPLTTLVIYLLTRPSLRFNPEFGKWPSIIGLSGLVLVTASINQVIERGSYFILGAFYSTNAVGIFFLAYSLSLQTVMLLSNNLGNVLFPSFSKLAGQPERHRAALIRAARLLVSCTIPVSIYLAVIADPLVRLLYADKWQPVIPVLQVLAAGMGLRIMGTLASASLQSKARFGTLLFVNVIRVVIFLPLAFIAAGYGLKYFAAASVAPFIVGPLLNSGFALGFSRDSFLVLRRILGLPLLISLVAASISLPVIAVMPDDWFWPLFSIIVTFAIFALSTVGLLRLLDPVLWAEIAGLRYQILRKDNKRYALLSAGDKI